MDKKFLFYLGAFILILLLVFRDLILHVSTNLLDWRDYPYIIWVMFQNITHLTNLDFVNFFETNAFYPNKLTLLFSDLLLPQSFILLPFLSITKNLILSFNLVFIITFIFNYLSSFLFWKQLFKNQLIAFLGSLFFIFSPFFYLEISHFQMLSFWPFLLTLYFLFKYEEGQKRRYLIIAGLFLTIQFLASVYLSVFLIFSILIFFLLKLLSQEAFNLFYIFFVFLITGGIFIKGYIDMRNTYGIERDIREYITYSANLSDYIFTSQIKSIVHQSTIIQKWNSADKNWGLHSSFPGFLIFLLSLFGLFSILKERRFITINVKLNREKTFFLLLIACGFIFSLGPRVNFNGNYAHIPLPYAAIIKFVPLAEVVRVPSRWSFIFFLGLIYFTLLGINKIKNVINYKLLITIMMILFTLEYLPLSISTSSEVYIGEDDQILKQLCQDKKRVLLKIPVTHLDVAPDIVTGLNYIAKTELSSTYHNCLMVNGYSGYDLPKLFDLKDKINNDIMKKDISGFLDLIEENNIDIVEFSPNLFTAQLKDPGQEFIKILINQSQIKKIGNIFLIH